jgi:hypothetical protein
MVMQQHRKNGIICIVEDLQKNLGEQKKIPLTPYREIKKTARRCRTSGRFLPLFPH